VEKYVESIAVLADIIKLFRQPRNTGKLASTLRFFKLNIKAFPGRKEKPCIISGWYLVLLINSI